MSSLDALRERVGTWADGLMGAGDDDRRALEVRTKFGEEAEEFLDRDIDADQVRQDEEAADCLIVLLLYDHRRRGAMAKAAEAKMGVNEARLWCRRDDGTFKHVERTP